jgi:hypothetical protein
MPIACTTWSLSEGGKPVIPPHRHRRYQHRYDKLAYQQRRGEAHVAVSRENIARQV